jgi:hypothetical protein
MVKKMQNAQQRISGKDSLRWELTEMTWTGGTWQ